MGTLLSWLSDHETDVFFLGTCNDVSKLAAASAGAFTRAERFDAIFFMDLPDKEQRAVIWDIYQKKYGLETQPRPEDEKWTGAEIKACCRMAYLLNVPLVEAAQQIVPVATTSGEQIDLLRGWANGRCLSADYKGIFDRNAKRKMMAADEVATPGRRRVVRQK